MTDISHLLGKVHCCDCLPFMRELPDKCVDLVLTDPPYGINGGTGPTSLKRGKGNYSGIFADTPEYIKNVCVEVIKEGIRIATAVVLTPGNSNFCLYPQPDSFGTFRNPFASGIQTFGMCGSQPIFYYGKNPTKKNMMVNLDFILMADRVDYGHPCVKPIKAWRQLLNTVSLPGQIVFDPFIGSGTTAVICEGRGRKWFGCELEPKYVEIANKRIEAERNQLKLF